MNEPVTAEREQPVKRPKWIIFTAAALVLAALIAGVVLLIVHGNSNRLEGSWRINETVYHFRENQTGYMTVGKGVYTFRYERKNELLMIDFDSDHIHDCVYQFSIRGGKLTLIGKDGTVGGTYELRREKNPEE